MNLIEAIKGKVSITDVYGKKLEGNRGSCGIHENTSSPSFVNYGEHWHCFSCGVGGDVISLYSHLNNVTNSQAIFELAKMHGLKPENGDNAYYVKLDQVKECLGKFARLCHSMLKKSELYEVIKQSRGFTDETMEHYMVGLYDSRVKQWLLKNYNEDFLVEAGFLTEKKTNYFGNRVVYPYLNSQNKPSYFIYRLIEGDKDFREDAKYIKHRRNVYIQEELFGVDSLSKFRDKPLIITEGITDAMSVIQCEYPCLSPVTIQFKKSDLKKILQYAKGFSEVIIINDTEKNKKGLEGALKTLKFLLLNKINGKIGMIPNPLELDKVDLNDYLKSNGVKGLDYLIGHSIEGFEYLCSDITEDTEQEELEEVLQLICRDDIVKRREVALRIKDLTNRKLGMKQIDAIYKKIDVKLKEKEKVKKKKKYIREMQDVILNLKDFRGWEIDIREDGIYKVQFSEEEGLYEEQVLDGTLELIHKTKYLGRDYFSYKFREDVFNTQSRTFMLMELRNFIYGGDFGKDIIKKVINEMSKGLEYKSCKQNMGFDNGWVLPFLEDENDYKILLYTDGQRQIYYNCKDLIKEHSIEETDNIMKKLKTFIDTTQMRKDKIALIIGWSMASVFKLPLLDYFKIFPGLMLKGDRQSGKTYFCSFFAVDFYGAWSHYLSGASIKTEARCEDFLATSSFPIHLDELEYVKYAIIEILKSTLTGVHDYIRKLNLIEEIRKPEIAPFCITTNEPPKPFLDPALNSKMIVIDYTAEEVIKDDPEWVNIYNELRSEKLFSFMYRHTKEWKNKDVFKILDEICKDAVFDDESRLRKKYLCIKYGLRLFKEIFDIDLLPNLASELFEFGERSIMEDLLSQFIVFLEKALAFEEDYEEERGNTGNEYSVKVKGSNPKYLTCPLRIEGDKYLFGQDNLRDFKEFSKENYNLKQLGNLLTDGLKDKELIKYDRTYYQGKQGRYIIIHKKVLELTEAEVREYFGDPEEGNDK